MKTGGACSLDRPVGRGSDRAGGRISVGKKCRKFVKIGKMGGLGRAHLCR